MGFDFSKYSRIILIGCMGSGKSWLSKHRGRNIMNEFLLKEYTTDHLIYLYQPEGTRRVGGNSLRLFRRNSENNKKSKRK